MNRDKRRDESRDNAGWHREPVHGSTYDRGGPYRETASGRNYPGSFRRQDEDRTYNRGPYNPPDRGRFEDEGRRRTAGGGVFGGPDLGAGMDEDWDRELGLREQWTDQPVRPADRAEDSTAGSGSAGGPHAGRGPRGFRRSDERIRLEVCERLTDHGAIDASDVEVSVEDGEVTLSGSVGGRGDKRLAERIADSVPDVRDVHNRLQVAGGGSGERANEG